LRPGGVLLVKPAAHSDLNQENEREERGSSKLYFE